jgi:predicted amidophosphoribosyltransferase
VPNADDIACQCKGIEIVVFPADESRLQMAAFGRRVLDFVFPPQCPICGKEIVQVGTGPRVGAVENLCRACVVELAPTAANQCERCSAPVGPHLDTSAGCIHCIGDPYSFDRAYSLGVYRDRLRAAVLSAKRDGGGPASAALARLLCQRDEVELKKLAIDVVIPIPHHWVERVVSRHLPPVILSRVIARRLRAGWLGDALKKVRRTPKQVNLTPTERRRNLRGAFRVSGASRLAGKTILLVDDVLTTGTTAHRATRALKQSGAGTVYVATIARGIGDRSHA